MVIKAKIKKFGCITIEIERIDKANLIKIDMGWIFPMKLVCIQLAGNTCRNGDITMPVEGSTCWVCAHRGKVSTQ